jgi:hypothetical protein
MSSEPWCLVENAGELLEGVVEGELLAGVFG